MIWLFLKIASPRDRAYTRERRSGARQAEMRIRCPRCQWQPSKTSTWSCLWQDTPEPPFDACGTIWNTFDTHGRCPGCAHQWVWTTCHACEVASLHSDWYETAGHARES